MELMIRVSEGLDRVIKQRLGEKVLGFDRADHKPDRTDRTRVFSKLDPGDLMKYGLIPELVGRLPVTCSLEELDGEALVRILTEPRNALVKQYTKQLALNGVKLKINKELKTVRRNLRSEIEQLGTTVKFMNIFMVPLLIGIGGIIYAITRRRKA